MAKQSRKSVKTAGLIPGTLIHTGEKLAENIKITIIDYNSEQFQEKEAKTVEECFSFRDSASITWINIDGIHDTDIIEKIGTHFGIHPLILEDIVDTGQRPKYEDLDGQMFIVLKMLDYDNKERGIMTEQMSLILGSNFVISFQEKEGDVFDPIRERIRNNKGRIRKMGADYLAYCLMDMIVDNYFLILEKLQNKVETLDDELLENPTPKNLHIIQSLKKEMIFLRKSVWPLREILSGLQRIESKLIKKGTIVFIRDVYDHTIHVIDSIETFRDMVSGMQDLYISSVSNKMNEIMKVLTIIATIFIPITFIAGVYGMNFNTQTSILNMPELNWRFGYLFALGLMFCSVSGMIVYFKRKKWL